MKIQKQIATISLLALIPGLGCAVAPQKTATNDKPNSATEEMAGRAVTNSAAVDAKAHDFVEIEFTQNSSILSSNAKSSLDRLIEQARKSGEIDEVMVLSWADQEYPSVQEAKLSKPQRELAHQRNKSIESYVKKNRSVSVDTYNMAQQPNVFSKWFNTTDNKLKKSFTSAGLPTSADMNQFPSKSSHSVIFVKLE